MKYYYKENEIVTPFTIESNEPVFDMTTISLKTQRASQGYQRWELNFSTVSSGGDKEVDSFLTSVLDISTLSTMVMPQLAAVDKTRTAQGEVLVASTFASGVTQVNLDKTTSSGILPKGSFFKFSNHPKVYVTLFEVNLNDLSNVELKFYPKLKVAVGDTTSIAYGSSCLFSYYRDVSNLKGITFTDGVMSSSGTISLVEAL